MASAASVVRQLPGRRRAVGVVEQHRPAVEPSGRDVVAHRARRRLGPPVATPRGPEHRPHPEPARGERDPRVTARRAAVGRTRASHRPRRRSLVRAPHVVADPPRRHVPVRAVLRWRARPRRDRRRRARRRARAASHHVAEHEERRPPPEPVEHRHDRRGARPDRDRRRRSARRDRDGRCRGSARRHAAARPARTPATTGPCAAPAASRRRVRPAPGASDPTATLLERPHHRSGDTTPSATAPAR